MTTSCIKTIAACAAVLCWLTTGCSMLNRDNTRLMNLYESTLVPEKDSPLRVGLAPLTVPGGWLCLTVDATLVNPACTLDDAWIDAADMLDALWSGQDWEAHYVRECVLSPFRALGSVTVVPATFVFSWTGRWVFDIDPAEWDDEPDDAGAELLATRLEEVRRHGVSVAGRLAWLVNALSRVKDAADVEAWLVVKGREGADAAVYGFDQTDRLVRLFTHYDRADVAVSYREPFKGEPLLAVLVLRSKRSTLIVTLDDEGFAVGSDYRRFGFEALARAMREVFDDRGLPASVDAARLDEALRAGAEARPLRAYLLDRFPKEYEQAIDLFLAEKD